MRNRQHGLAWLGLVVLTAGSLSLSAQRQNYRRGPDLISGTYQLESTRGDNPQRAADLATRDLQGPRRDRAYQNLLTRLEAPDTLAIDRNGRTVTVASSRAPRVTFDADGQTHSEAGPNGRTILTRAALVGDGILVSTSGNRGSDFSVTFEPLDNGHGLRVTRRLDNEELGQPVTAQSYYRKVANEPRLDLYASEARYPVASRSRPGIENFSVPDGTRLLATLDTPLRTSTSRSGDRFTMTVRSPYEFEGARIDGIVSRVNADQQRNQADMRVDFESIRLRDGRTYELSAILNTVRTPDGDTLRVDPEGGVRDVSQNETRIEHGVIGGAIGAIIGAIAGGGKGAAIGAAVGGAGGAILVEGRGELDLPPGTEVTIIATGNRYPQ
jgi:hypothetical protein